MADKSVESGLAVLPSPHWARDLHGETEVYTAEEVRAFLAHAHAREAQDARRWRTYERELPMSAGTVRGFVDRVIARDAHQQES